ncbi:iron complex outermembrane receptor protein [Variovorax sp. TBS-050B]|uniref:TonB-dependent siderophore receptor n=1 Tax=Variovorax sp. TBS-050B TaxID=2940551 RepID=UPI002473A405|nr:TonB-dependent siderophore receptor [Variovorax sp. TBS-050B]MDH6590320.1 iron complex outermembrane receptor protein [Variovorax sp. TBS-050B]
MGSQHARRHHHPGTATVTLAAAAVHAALRAAFVGGVGMAALAANPVFAAEPAGNGARQFAIGAGPLADVLAQYAASAGVQLIFEPATLAGLRSPGLRGRYTVQEGFEQVLRGSGYEVVGSGSGGSMLRKAGAPSRSGAADAGAVMLSPVTVTATTERETPTGRVDGYVARRSLTATKTDTALIENPQSVSVITADEIGDRKAESLDQALRYTAGVTPNLKPWAVDEFSLLRGFELGTAGVFMDGLLTSGRSYAAPIEPYGLERLEVLRGPASVLYGKMPPGGMVNAVSKRPSADTLREIGIEYGSYDRKQFKADLSGALGSDSDWTYRLTVLGRESNTRLDRDRDNRLFIAPALTWQPSASTRLTLLGRYQKDNQAYAWPNQLEQPGVFGQTSPRVNIGADDNRWRRDNKMLGYEFEHSFDDTWSVQQSMRYSELDRSETNVFPRGLRADGYTLGRSFSPRETHWKGLLLDTRVQARFDSGPLKHTVLAGVDYARSRTTDEFPYDRPLLPSMNLFAPVYMHQPLAPAADPYVDRAPSKQVGLYLQDQIKWDRWVLTAGVRHDKAEATGTRTFGNTGERSEIYDTSASATTGRVGVVYLFDSGWAPYANYATSFSPEIGKDLNGNLLKPSKGRQIEAGVRYQPNGRNASYTASVFDIVRSNVTTAAPQAPGEVIQTGEVRSRGLELEARADVTNNISLVAQYTYLDTRITRSNDGDLGLPQMSAPRHSVSVWGKYAFPVGDATRAFAALGVRYLGKARSAWDTGNANITNPGIAMVDLAFGFDRGPWRVSLNLSNLLNKQSLMDCNGSLCYRSAERTANLSALYRF